MAKVFNSFVSQECQPISNDSILSLLPTFYTNKRLNDINLNYDQISKVIYSLDQNKTSGQNCISVKC